MEFPPDHNNMPVISNHETATIRALYLIEAITNTEQKALFASIGDIKLQAIINLADIFKQKTYECEDHFLFPIFRNNIINKETHERKEKCCSQLLGTALLTNHPQGDSTNEGGCQT